MAVPPSDRPTRRLHCLRCGHSVAEHRLDGHLLRCRRCDCPDYDDGIRSVDPERTAEEIVEEILVLVDQLRRRARR